MRLQDFSIGAKIVGSIVVLASIVLGGTTFTVMEMRSITAGYQSFLGHDARARLGSAKMRNDVNTTTSLIFQFLLEPDDTKMKALLRRKDEAEAVLMQDAQAIKTLTPQYAENVDALLEEYQATKRAAKPAMDIGAQNDFVNANKAATTQFIPLANKLDEHLVALRDLIDRKTQAGAAELSGRSDSVVWLSVGTMLGGVLVGIILSWIIAQKGIVKPVLDLSACMQTLSQGKYDLTIPGIGRKDELGLMASNVEVFRKNGMEGDRLRAQQEEDKHRAEVEKRALMEKMAGELEASVGTVIQQVTTQAAQMQSSATAMSATAEETTKQASAVAAASAQSAANVQTVASATEELSSSIAEIARQVSHSSRIAANAVSEAGKANEMVQGLLGASQKIGEVIALINDIADQTNLLALNATIEAARAGEAGKGFAVVAAEVKNLATQTAKATEEIGAQITGVQGATQDAVKAIASIGKTISEIDQIATTIAAAVEEQGAATQEIARNVEEAAKGTQEVSSNIGGVTEAANGTGAAANEVSVAAGALTSQSGRLKGAVEQFLSGIRAA